MRNFVFVLLALTMLHCSGQNTADRKKADEKRSQVAATGLTPAQANKVVARVGDKKITVGDLTEQINNLSPYIRRRWAAPEKRKEFLQKVVEIEMLSQEALKQGYGDAPEVKRAVEQVMIRLLIKNDLHKQILPREVTDAETRAAYDEQWDKYHRPRRKRISHILLKTQAEAEAVIRELQAGDKSRGAFRSMAQERSIDGETAAKGGDLGYVIDPAEVAKNDKIEQTAGMSLALVEAGWALETRGQLAATPIKSSLGYHVIRLDMVKPAMNRSFNSVRKLLEKRLLREKRRQRMDAFIASLRDKAEIKIYQENLKQVEVPVQETELAPYGDATDSDNSDDVDHRVDGEGVNGADSPAPTAEKPIGKPAAAASAKEPVKDSEESTRE